MRALRACDPCRRLKEKCFGGMPCKRCTRMCRTCTFSERPVRGYMTPGRSLTGTSSDHKTRRIHCMEKILTHYVDGIDLSLKSLEALAQSIDADTAYYKGLQYQLDQLPSPNHSETGRNNSPSNLVQKLERCDAAGFSDVMFLARMREWIKTCDPMSGREELAASLELETQQSEQLRPTSDIQLSISKLPPRWVAEFLVQVFFDHAVTIYFYVDQTWLLEKLDYIYQSPQNLGQSDASTLCIVWTVLAIGTQYAYLGSQKEDGNEPQRMSKDACSFSEDSLGLSFYQQARQLIPDVIVSASLESVQAMLLIGVYTMPLEAQTHSYVYLNIALRLAIQSNMHRRSSKSSSSEISSSINEIRDRVWWTVYTTEKRLAICCGKPTSVSRFEVDVDLPQDQSCSMPSNQQSGAHMCASVRLSHALEDVSLCFQVARADREHESLKAISQIQDELDAWWNSHIATTSLGSLDPHSRNYRSNVHLRLQYFLDRIYAGRLSMLGTQRKNNSVSPNTEGTSETDSNTDSEPGLRDHLVDACVKAALSITDLCHGLQETVGQARASRLEFSSCHTALFVLIYKFLNNKTDELYHAIRKAIRFLEGFSGNGLASQMQVPQIRAFEQLISKYEVQTKSTTVYSEFKRWQGYVSSVSQEPEPAPLSGLNMVGCVSEVGDSFLDTNTPLINAATAFMTPEEEFAIFNQFLGDSSVFCDKRED